MEAPDYFPVKPGLVLEYRTRSASGSGRMTLEVLDVDELKGVVQARMRRTTKWGEEKTQDEYEVLKDGTGVYSNHEPEFPVPPRLGRTWDRYPNEYRVEALDAVTTVPAGTFRRCLRVDYLIGAGGAGGSGRRFYAPGVGLVRDERDDETDPYEFILLSTREKRP